MPLSEWFGEAVSHDGVVGRPEEYSPDLYRLTVDGELFEIRYDESQPGTYHYTRLSGPAVGYGFTSRHSNDERSLVAQHETQIRTFLSMVDPTTGFIEDGGPDGGDE